MFEYNADTRVYYPGVGAYELLGSIFSESLIFSPTVHFLQDFPLNDILKVFPIHMHWQPMLTLP